METSARASRTGSNARKLAAALLGALALGAPGTALAEDVTVQLRWLQPEGEQPEGWVAHIGTEPGVYTLEIDLGSPAASSHGMRKAPLIVDSLTSYVVALSAYNEAGESPLSNEIALAPATCAEAGCDDGNPCTADSCEGEVCENVALDDGTACQDVEIIGQCVAGGCQPLACISDQDCGTATGCAAPTCVPSVGCMAVLQPDKTRCDDGLAWTKKDRCDAGVCVGKKRKGLRGKRPRNASAS
jgi:hypothetical protein